MTPRSAGKSFLQGAALVLALDVLVVSAFFIYFAQTGQPQSFVRLAIYGVHGLLLLSFLFLARKDIYLLFSRPAKGAGRGFSRIGAVARTTIFEAWAGRIWLLPVLWFISASVLILAAVPFDETERIPLYIRTILSTQEILLLLMMWVMACVSLPRERERKTLVSTASKPISRLEILLGKLTGFAAVTAFSLLVMGTLSLIMLFTADARLRTRAREAYQLQKSDFNKTLQTPSEGLLQLAERGSLFSYNNIQVPEKGGLNLGVMAFSPDPNEAPRRYFMGGTSEKAVYRFSPSLQMHELMVVAPTGKRPYFGFVFPYLVRGQPPSEIRIRVTAYASGPGSQQNAVIKLNRAGQGFWEPEQPEELFSTFDNSGNILTNRGVVTLEVSCLTPGILLQVLEGGEVDPVTGNPPRNTPTNIEFNNRLKDYFPQVPLMIAIPDMHPTVRGFERRERQEVAGLDENKVPKSPSEVVDREQAMYRFTGSSLRNIPLNRDGTFNLAVQFETFKGPNPSDPTFVGIQVHSLDPTGVPDYMVPKLEVSEKRIMTIPVPAANLGDKDPARRGDLIVMVYCATPGHSISLIEDSVRIELPPTPFIFNFIKSEFVIFAEAMTLIAISVACSVRLGWAVAMFCSGICVSFGILVNFIASLSLYGGLGALNYADFLINSSSLYQFFDTAARNIWSLLAFISSIVPNFTIFQPDKYIGTLHNMPWSVLSEVGSSSLFFFIPFLAISYLLFRKQELG